MIKLNSSDISILYVDDELNQNKAKIIELEEEGFNVTAVDNAKDALELIKKNYYDILLSDYFMPEVTGEDLIKEVRESNKRIYIILQTAYASKKPEKQMMEELNINAYYDKSQPIQSLLLNLKQAKKTIDYLTENENLIQQNAQLDADLTETKKIVDALKRDKELLLQREQMANLGEISRRLADTILWPCSAFRYTIDTLVENFESYDEMLDRKGFNQETYKFIKDQTLNAIKYSKVNIEQLEEIGNAILAQSDRVKTSTKQLFKLWDIIKNYKKLINEGRNRYSVGIQLNQNKQDERISTVIIEGDYSNMLFILTKLYEGIAKSCIEYKDIAYYTEISEYINLDYNIKEKSVELILWYESKLEPNINILEENLTGDNVAHGRDNNTGIYFQLALFSVNELIQQYNGTLKSEKLDKKITVVLTIPITFEKA